MGQSREREEMREAELKKQAAMQDAQILKVVEELKKNYEGMKAILPVEGSEVKKALDFLREKIEAIKKGWAEKLLDSKVTHIEKDVILGQHNAAGLAIEIIEQTFDMGKGMVEGKEADFVREKLFKNKNQ